ncbi:MAG: hypothetical protein ACKPFK_05680, partial [Dolichospermum sp.]
MDTTSDQVAEDPAFTWLRSCISDEDRYHTDVLKHKTLLLGLRDWPYSEYAHNLSRSESQLLKSRFEGEVIKALEQLVEKYPNLKIIPFPMCTNHIGNDDRWFYRRLFRNANKIHDSLDLTYLGAEISPVEAVNVF